MHKHFDFICPANGNCQNWYCQEKGVVLAYDGFSPEIGIWFCAYHWQLQEPGLYTIAEDHRLPTMPIEHIRNIQRLMMQCLDNHVQQCPHCKLYHDCSEAVRLSSVWSKWGKRELEILEQQAKQTPHYGGC